MVRNDHETFVPKLVDPRDVGASQPAYRRGTTTRRDEMAPQAERFETVIVGGGQAGLATGYHLAGTGRSL